MLFKIYVSQEFIKFLPFHKAKLLLDPFCSSVTEGTKDHLCKLKSEKRFSQLELQRSNKLQIDFDELQLTIENVGKQIFS